MAIHHTQLALAGRVVGTTCQIREISSKENSGWKLLGARQLSMKLKPTSIADPSHLFLTIRIKRSLWHHLISYCVMTAITWKRGPSHHPLRPQMMRIGDLTWDSLWSTSFGSSGVRSTSRDIHPGGVCLKDIFWGRDPWCSPRLIIGHVYSGHWVSSHRFSLGMMVWSEL